MQGPRNGGGPGPEDPHPAIDALQLIREIEEYTRIPERPGGSVSVADYAKATGLPVRRASRDLRRAWDEGFLDSMLVVENGTWKRVYWKVSHGDEDKEGQSDSDSP